MRPPWPFLGLVSVHICAVAADYLIGTYPAPADLTSRQSSFPAAWKNLTSTFDDYMKGTHPKSNHLIGTENVTFSVGMFSLHDPDARQLQYHYASPETKVAKFGSRKPDGDSIYRVESISKLITTLIGMIQFTQEDWNRPLTQIHPGFKHLQGVNASDPVWAIQWDTITPWALATQLSGIPTGYLSHDAKIGLPPDAYSPSQLKAYGAPAIDFSAFSNCTVGQKDLDVFCSVQEAVATVDKLPPNFQPWTNPAYSDLNFVLLGIMLSEITRKELSSLYRESLFDPLDMSSTFYHHPTDQADIDRSIIPEESFFDVEPIIGIPSGGILSTTSDLQKLGIGILNYTLLSADTTRKWMKPTSQTASLSYAVGAPWEIQRYIHPDTGRITDLYTKLGDSTLGGGALVLIPQYDAGFTMLNAATTPSRSGLAMVILDYVTNAVLPALEAQALTEAKRNFVGTYSSTDPNLNASIKIGYNKSSAISVKSDLLITEWTYNGSNVLEGSFFEGGSLRLEQSIPNQYGTNGQVAFQLSDNIQTPTYTDAMQIPDLDVYGPWTGFYSSYGDFFFTDKLRWGGVGARLFVFEVDENGKATTCSPAVERIKLRRVDEGCD